MSVIIAGLVLGVAVNPGASSDGARISTAEINSVALGRLLPVSVVVPDREHTIDRPVFYLLHGRGRHHRSLLDSDRARAALLAAPFVVVLPQGEDGWYIDSPARLGDRYNAYLEEVVGWAERNLRVSKSAARRGIAGWSMGGYGAVSFAQAHAGEFGFVASVIGLLDFPRLETLAEGRNYKVPIQRFTGDPSVWREYNPLHRIGHLRGATLTLVLATRGFERTMNENFIAALGAENKVARVHWFDGGHEFSLVEAALPTVIADAAEFFAGSEPAP